MQGADPTGRTIYVGTFAKTLFPALRLGFMVLPPGLLDPVRRAINITGQFAPLVLQATLADFMDRGMFAQHLRRMRRLYARRRDMLVSIGQEHVGHWLSNVSSDAGIQTLWNSTAVGVTSIWQMPRPPSASTSHRSHVTTVTAVAATV